MNRLPSPYIYPGLRTPPVTPTPEEVINMVCDYHRIHPEAIRHPGRQKAVVRVRQECAYLIRKYVPGTSLPKIGSLLQQDHSTIIHGISVVTRKLADDDGYATEFYKMTDSFYFRPIKNI